MTFSKNTTVRQFALSTPSIKDKWDLQKTRLMKKYPSLTESDLRYSEGQKGAMWEKIQIKLGLTKEEMRKIINSK